MGLSWQAVMAHHGSLLVQPSRCVAGDYRINLTAGLPPCRLSAQGASRTPPAVVACRRVPGAAARDEYARQQVSKHQHCDDPVSGDIIASLGLTSFSASAGLKGELYRFTGTPLQSIRNCMADTPTHKVLELQTQQGANHEAISADSTFS
jgi:hypothetical protein